MDVVVSGSTGLIGTALLEALASAGHRPIRLSRPGSGAPGESITWDPAAGIVDAASLEGVGAVVHLAGAGIGDHRWNDAHKRAVRESRTQGTTLLATTLASLRQQPEVLISGSAIGYYGDRGDEQLTESSPPGTGFLPEVCLAWEGSTAPAAAAGIRVVTIRTGIVLTPRGGSLKRMLPLFKLGVGGRFGNGRQWMSWITLDDEVGAIVHLLGTDHAGPANLTAPAPVTNAEFTAILGHVLHRPTLLPIPRFGPALVMGGELVDNLLYSGQRVLPAALLADGYTFRHPDLDGALHELLGHDHGHDHDHPEAEAS